MWYKTKFRRHLCDMHIDDWNDEFLSKFDPMEYVENLKIAKIQSAMLYFQSHVGLCYFPTKSGKMHNGFIGKQYAMQRLEKLCHQEGISVTGYYSLIYNNVEHDRHPGWRMIDENGNSKREIGVGSSSDFSGSASVHRYGFCCPNNMEYRDFIQKQIKEMNEYFTVDGMFYDMLFWPHMCYCDSCQKRWEAEVGGEIPKKQDWNDKMWLLHMQKRREWMGEFAHWVTDYTKKLFGNISVEHNVAFSALPDSTTANCEEVIDACDYAGGDLYRDPYIGSFTRKFYRSITKNSPFEYMVARSTPNLSVHTQIKSEDSLESAVLQTVAHHGATLIIDAIDPVGTLNKEVYRRIGKVFEKSSQYEQYMTGEPVEQVGVYYSLKSKFSTKNDIYTNYLGTVSAIKTMINNNILVGVTGGFSDLSKYDVIVASALTQEDDYDCERIAQYVNNGGNLYFSGGDNKKLLKVFFNAEVKGLTKEKKVYIAPKENIQHLFKYFNAEYPLNFDECAYITQGFEDKDIFATLTLPYTHQGTNKFSSIHSNPPGIKTDIPAIAIKKYGKGTVVWSACCFESMDIYDHQDIFINILKYVFGFKSNLLSDAPQDVEITAFDRKKSIQINCVLIDVSRKARKIADFSVSYKCDNKPQRIVKMPDKTKIPFTYKDGMVHFEVNNMKIHCMYEIEF